MASKLTADIAALMEGNKATGQQLIQVTEVEELMLHAFMGGWRAHELLQGVGERNKAWRDYADKGLNRRD